MAGIGVLLRRFTALLGLCLMLCGAAANPYLPAREAAPLLAAIAREKPDFVVPQGVTGIIVPHHLLAVDLIARGYWAASAGHYTRVIVISPDHFHRVGMAFGTTRNDLETVFGAVKSDAAGVAALLRHTELVEALPDVEHEHGIMVEAPFIRHFFPTAEVIPILASVNAGPAEWRAMTELLKPLVTPTTLVVQSTDFSHYRPLAEALARDQESLEAITTGDPEQMVPLLQPSHLDSKAAGYIELALQKEVFGSYPVILANGNSVEYGGDAGSTTSYVVAAFVRNDADGTAFGYKDQSRTMFAGDVLLGRYFLPALRDKAAWTKIRDVALGLTRRLPLIVNFEGVLLDGPVTGVGAHVHVMVPDDAAPMLAALHVMAASLANNHANDLVSAPRGSGALLELRVFRQGTVAARLVPVANLFDLARE